MPSLGRACRHMCQPSLLSYPPGRGKKWAFVAFNYQNVGSLFTNLQKRKGARFIGASPLFLVWPGTGGPPD